jgi:hypothetical protein
MDSDIVTLAAVLSGGGQNRPIVFRVTKEGVAWKVDAVTIGSE